MAVSSVLDIEFLVDTYGPLDYHSELFFLLRIIRMALADCHNPIELEVHEEINVTSSISCVAESRKLGGSYRWDNQRHENVSDCRNNKWDSTNDQADGSLNAYFSDTLGVLHAPHEAYR